MKSWRKYLFLWLEMKMSLNTITCFSLSMVPQMHGLKEKESQNSQVVVERILGNISGWVEWQIQSSTKLQAYMYTSSWAEYIQVTHCAPQTPKTYILPDTSINMLVSWIIISCFLQIPTLICTTVTSSCLAEKKYRFHNNSSMTIGAFFSFYFYFPKTAKLDWKRRPSDGEYLEL